MIIYEPELDNSESLELAAEGLESGEIVNVYLLRKSNNETVDTYRRMMETILGDRGHSREAIGILIIGLYVILEDVRNHLALRDYDDDDCVGA